MACSVVQAKYHELRRNRELVERHDDRRLFTESPVRPKIRGLPALQGMREDPGTSSRLSVGSFARGG